MNKLSLTLALSTTLLLSLGCNKKSEPAQGPMESAGEEADQAAEKTGDKVEEAGDKVEDAADDATK